MIPVQVVNRIFTNQLISGTDLTVKTSGSFDVESFREKSIHVIATHGLSALHLGPLWLWAQLSNDNVNWSAIGGESFAGVPYDPAILVSVGAANPPTYQTIIPWSIHSKYARLRAQMPAVGTSGTMVWTINAYFGGGGG